MHSAVHAERISKGVERGVANYLFTCSEWLQPTHRTCYILYISTTMAIREQLLPFVRQRRQSLSVQFLVYVFAVALFPGLARCAVDNDSTTPLHILYITSSGGGYDSSGTRPAVDMAIERINNDTAVLPEYTLDIIEADSQVSMKC